MTYTTPEQAAAAIESITTDGKTKTWAEMTESERTIVRDAFAFMYSEKNDADFFVMICSTNKHINDLLEGGLIVSFAQDAETTRIIVTYDGGPSFDHKEQDLRDQYEAKALPFVAPARSTFFQF